MPALAVRQKTLKTSISCTGIGVHSGSRVTMWLHPAEPSSGIVFRRSDVGGVGGARIQAEWRNVANAKLCTALGEAGGPQVATVEHLMAALCGCEIDNAIVELNGPEVPIMDGSAAPFVFLIECAGIVEQPAPRRAIQLLHRLSVDGGDGRVVSLTPAPGFSASFEIDFDNAAIAHQEYVISVHPSTFKAEIARARTFGFAHEIDGLRAAGLARGGSLENAVVISGNRILNRDGLRYDDEFVRHKILDGVGDLYLAGAPLLGHFHGLRSGHSLNHHLLRTLFARPKAWRYVELAVDRLVAPAAAHPALGAYPAAGD